MIQLSYSRLLTLICFVVSIGVLSSCKKDNNSDDGRIQLFSFGPTGSKIGDTLRFIGVHLDKVTAIKFTGDSAGATIASKDFKMQTPGEIRVIVPTAAERGKVTLKTPDGDIVSKAFLDLNVLSTISSYSRQGRPGGTITVTGTYLNWIDKVIFTKGAVSTDFVSKSQTQLVVKIPDAAQTGPLTFHYAGTDSAYIEMVDTVAVTLPAPATFSPNLVKHADNITITGTDLDLVRSVTFTGEANPVTTFVSQSATQLVVKVPAGTTKGAVKVAPGSGIQVTVPGGNLDLVLPAVTSISPNPIDTAKNVTLTGTNLDLVTSISFADTAAGKTRTVASTSFVSQSATQIVVKVPGGSSSGKLTLGVKNSTVTVKSSTLLGIIGFPPPPIIIYNDALNWNGWVGNGWNGTKDLNNTSPVKSGTKSIRIDYTSGGYGVPLQLGGANIPIDGYTVLKVSIYGGAGSDGKSVNIGFNEQDGKTVTLVEGQWNDFTIPLSQISSATTLSFLYFKNYSASGAFTIYIDDLGIY